MSKTITYGRIEFDPDGDHPGAWVKKLVMTESASGVKFGWWTWVRLENVPAGSLNSAQV